MQVFKPNIFLIFLVTVDLGLSRDNDNIISEVTSNNHDHHLPVQQGFRPRRKVRSITTTKSRFEELSSTTSNVQDSTTEIKSSDVAVEEEELATSPISSVTVTEVANNSLSTSTAASSQEDAIETSSTSPPSQEDAIETITDTFLSAISRDIPDTQNRRKDVKDESSRSLKKKIQEPTADLTSFGKLTTEDPITALLRNVEIIDVRNFVPRGYRFSHNHVEKDGKKMMKDFGRNINDLLDDKKFRNKRLKKISPRGKHENNKNDDHVENEQSKAEADLYHITFGGPKPRQGKSKFGWVDLEDKRPESAKLAITPNFQESGFFESLLSESQGHQQTSQHTHLQSTTTSPTTTSAQTDETTTAELFVVECGRFCSLHGNILITEGLLWSTKLLHEVTEDFKQNKKKFEQQCSKIFKHVYFGSAFEFCSLQSFAKALDGVKVLFSLQFNGLIFNITSKDIYKAFRDYMEFNHDDNMMGDYRVEIDSAYFLVVDSDLSDGTLGPKFAKYGVELPDWAWLVVIASIVCILIVAVLGITIGVQRHKQDIAVQRKLLNSKALKSVRSPDAFDMVQLDRREMYDQDKRDIWTLQRVLAEESKAKKVKKKKTASDRDSGRGSIGSGPTVFRQISKLSSGFLRGTQELRPLPKTQTLSGPVNLGISVNDSHAGLLADHDLTSHEVTGHDNLGFDATGMDNFHPVDVVGENKDVDFDTSYENNTSDGEAREDFEDEFTEDDSQRQNFSRNMLLKSFRHKRTVSQMSTDSEKDAVSDGPSEKF